MNPIYSEKCKINSYHAGFDGNLKISSLLGLMQEAAGNSAEELGVGWQFMKTRGFFWILSRIKIEFISFPKWGDEILIETWPKGNERLFFLRDFFIKDSGGKLLASASTCWLLTEIERMRPVKLESAGLSFPIATGYHAILKMPEKLKPFNELLFSHKQAATINDIDVNRHVGNTRYYEWLLNCFPQEYLAEHEVSKVQLNFLSECKYGENIDIFKSASEDSLSYFVRGISQIRNIEVFQGLVDFKS